ncbi:MAG: hypothetical protein K8S98_00210, partial [Planctomycetes bacterium]|nr:hypothetical protein [Planctomycetota bacterium]
FLPPKQKVVGSNPAGRTNLLLIAVEVMRGPLRGTGKALRRGGMRQDDAVTAVSCAARMHGPSARRTEGRRFERSDGGLAALDPGAR